MQKARVETHLHTKYQLPTASTVEGKDAVASCRLSIQKTDYRFLNARMASFGSGAEKTALPATSTSAPASTRREPVSKFTPPSTSIKACEPVTVINSRNSRTLSRECSMNFCPPKPGFTLIISTMYTSLIISFNKDTGVAGLIVTMSKEIE